MTSPMPDRTTAGVNRRWRLPPARFLLGGLLVAMAAARRERVG